jgi:hypothetical protein
MGGLFFAMTLGAAAIAAALLAAWMPSAACRLVRFAAALLAAPALSYGLTPFIPAFQAASPFVLLLAAAPAPAALALAMRNAFGRAPSLLLTVTVLLIAGLSGLAAVTTGLVFPVLLILIMACGAIANSMVRQARGRVALQGVAGSLAFPAGIFAFLHSAGNGQFLLFFACGLLGLALALTRVSSQPVEIVRDLRGGVIAH